MAVAFDASSTLADGTGDRNFTHTPAGTPRGALVIIVSDSATDMINGVTYDGVAMTEVALSPLTVAGEGGTVYGFFLGTGLPTGAKTVAIDTTSASNYLAACFTVTAGNDTEIHDTSTLSSTSQSNPTVTLTITQESYCVGGLYSGTNAVGNITAGTDTSEVVEAEFGGTSNNCGQITRLTTGTKSADFAYGWTVAADDAGVLAVAITESAPQIVYPPYRQTFPMRALNTVMVIDS